MVGPRRGSIGARVAERPPAQALAGMATRPDGTFAKINGTAGEATIPDAFGLASGNLATARRLSDLHIGQSLLAGREHLAGLLGRMAGAGNFGPGEPGKKDDAVASYVQRPRPSSAAVEELLVMHRMGYRASTVDRIDTVIRARALASRHHDLLRGLELKLHVYGEDSIALWDDRGVVVMAGNNSEIEAYLQKLSEVNVLAMASGGKFKVRADSHMFTAPTVSYQVSLGNGENPVTLLELQQVLNFFEQRR